MAPTSTNRGSICSRRNLLDCQPYNNITRSLSMPTPIKSVAERGLPPRDDPDTGTDSAVPTTSMSLETVRDPTQDSSYLVTAPPTFLLPPQLPAQTQAISLPIPVLTPVNSSSAIKLGLILPAVLASLLAFVAGVGLAKFMFRKWKASFLAPFSWNPKRADIGRPLGAERVPTSEENSNRSLGYDDSTWGTHDQIAAKKFDGHIAGGFDLEHFVSTASSSATISFPSRPLSLAASDASLLSNAGQSQPSISRFGQSLETIQEEFEDRIYDSEMDIAMALKFALRETSALECDLHGTAQSQPYLFEDDEEVLAMLSLKAGIECIGRRIDVRNRPRQGSDASTSSNTTTEQFSDRNSSRSSMTSLSSIASELSVESSIQNAELKNDILGRGSEVSIPGNELPEVTVSAASSIATETPALAQTQPPIPSLMITHPSVASHLTVDSSSSSVTVDLNDFPVPPSTLGSVKPLYQQKVDPFPANDFTSAGKRMTLEQLIMMYGNV